MADKIIRRLDWSVLERLDKYSNGADMFFKDDQIWKETAWRTLSRKLENFPANNLIVRITSGENKFLLLLDNCKPDVSRKTFELVWDTIKGEGSNKLKNFTKLFNSSVTLKTEFVEKTEGVIKLLKNNTNNAQLFVVKLNIFPAYPRDFSFFFRLDQVEGCPEDKTDWTEVKVTTEWQIGQEYKEH